MGFSQDITFDTSEIEKQLVSLAEVVPATIPKALKAMGKVYMAKIKDAAPYDEGNKDGSHLRDALGLTRVKEYSNGAKHINVTIKKRGEGDKNIYKAILSEYGSSRQPARPFWRTAEQKAEQEALEAGRDTVYKEIEKINNLLW